MYQNGVAGAVTLNQMVTATSDLSATTPATLSGSHAGSPSALVIPDGVAGAVDTKPDGVGYRVI